MILLNFLSKLFFPDFAVVGLYLTILLFIAWRSHRRVQQEETLFLAGRSLNWAGIGFNMWGTNVGPSMLLAFASIGYSTGMVAIHFEWYAFVFLLLLALVFAPRYLSSGVTTLPEFMGRYFGDKTRTLLAWYALVKMLISWLSLGLFAGGLLVRQILDLPFGPSVVVLVTLAGLIASTGGLRLIAKVNTFQMCLLIFVSALLLILGLNAAGGITRVLNSAPEDYWRIIKPANDPGYPWPALLLGYPVAAIAFFCTDQAMVQSVLGARTLSQGQLGINFLGWLKILSLPLFILPGIICHQLFPGLQDPNLAYMTMVTNLFPPGLNGLVLVVLMAVLMGTIASSLNSLSTVFVNDVYLRYISPKASVQDQKRIGRFTILVGCVLAVITALAIDAIEGLNLFDVFQSILGFIAPPLAVAFLLAVGWKRTTSVAINFILTGGALLSLGVGVCYLWIWPSNLVSFWPHYLLLSFFLFVFLMVCGVLISLVGKKPETRPDFYLEKPSGKVIIWWLLLCVVMISLYFIFS